MTYNRQLAVFLMLLPFGSPAFADGYIVGLPVGLVMLGTSSAGSNQVWFRTSGQPAGVPADCVSGSGSSMVSSFYIPNDGNIDPSRAEALLLTAKGTNLTISFAYTVTSTTADFYGFGTTKCSITRIVLGS